MTQQDHTLCDSHPHRVCVMNSILQFSWHHFPYSWWPSVAIFNCCKVDQSNKAQRVRWKAFHASLEHTAHKQPSLLLKILQNPFKPRKCTQNRHIQKPLLSQDFCFRALSKPWDLRRHPVQPPKIYSFEFRFFPSTQWKKVFFTHGIVVYFIQICYHMASYKFTRQALMRPRLCAVWREGDFFFGPPAQSRCS